MIRLSVDKKPNSLRFIDYVRMMPPAWVFGYLLKKNGPKRKILSSDVIRQCVRNFSRTDSLRSRFGSLDIKERLLCSLAYLRGADGITAHSVPGHSGGLDNPLIRSFLVYAGRNSAGEVRYFGFPEFEPALRSLNAAAVAGAGICRGSRHHVKTGSHAYGQLNDMAVIAVLATQGALSRRKPGGLTRSAHESVTRLACGGRECPSDLLIFCGLKSEILKEGEEGYSLSEEEFEKWMSIPPDRRLAGLVESALDYSGSWNVELLREVFRFSGGSPITSRVFPEKDRAAAINSLRCLRWAGMVEVFKAGDETLFGPSPARESTPAPACGAVAVLPDFTVVIPQETTPEQLHAFGMMGRLESLDGVYRGCIDRRVINDSLAGGVRAVSLLGSLDKWQAPRNIVETVKEWIREFGRLYITGSQVLVVADDRVAYEIGSYPPLRGLIEKVQAHTLFRIRSGAEAAVKDILNSMNYDFRMPKSEPGPAGRENRTEKGIFTYHTWLPVVGETAETSVPSLDLRGKKYGSGFKSFDLNETMHVIDYAILTGQGLMIDYGGSRLLRKGIYNVSPFRRSDGNDPVLEGEVTGGGKKRFQVRKISRIGVGVS